MSMLQLMQQMQSISKPWKSWAFYSTFAVALVGAAPTGLDLYKAYKFGVSYGDVSRAEEQRRLWAKNFQCTTTLSYQEVQTQENVIVKVGACSTGDVLINAVFPQEKQQIVEWVSLDRLKSVSAGLLTLTRSAYAQEGPAGGGSRLAQAATDGEVRCQEWSDSSQTTVIRVVEEGGQCFRETIDVLTGQVGDRRDVPCDTQCKPS